MTTDEFKGPNKLSVVVFSGDFSRVHYALVLASSAAAIGRPATLFFTMEACRMLTESWRNLVTADGRNAGVTDDSYVVDGVASFEELLAACVELGVRFIVCEMGLRAIGLAEDSLRHDLPIETAGAVTFLTDASANGLSLFI